MTRGYSKRARELAVTLSEKGSILIDKSSIEGNEKSFIRSVRYAVEEPVRFSAVKKSYVISLESWLVRNSVKV